MSNLPIVDLHQEEELSSSELGNVAGGLTCPQGKDLADALNTAGTFFAAAGFRDIGATLANQAQGVLIGACDGDNDDPPPA